MAYTTDTNNKIVEFINRSQTRIGEISTLIASRVAKGSRRETFQIESEMGYFLDSFIMSLDNRFNNWTELDVVKCIEMWSNAANINDDQPYFEHEKYNLNILFSPFTSANFTQNADLDMLGYKIKNLGAGVNAGDAVNKGQLDQKVTKTGDSMSGPLAMTNNKVTGLAAATAPGDALRFEQLPASLPPSGAAGGDLSGTYPNPSVNDDSHSHTPGGTIPAYPTTLPPNGAAGGDLTGTYPNPNLSVDRVRKTGDGITGDLTFSGGAKVKGLPAAVANGEALIFEQLPSPYASFNSQAGSYALQASDNGKTVRVTGAGTVSVPAGLPTGFECVVERAGAGAVDIAASGTTVNSPFGYLNISAQYGKALVTHNGSNIYTIGGLLS